MRPPRLSNGTRIRARFCRVRDERVVVGHSFPPPDGYFLINNKYKWVSPLNRVRRNDASTSFPVPVTLSHSFTLRLRFGHSYSHTHSFLVSPYLSLTHSPSPSPSPSSSPSQSSSLSLSLGTDGEIETRARDFDRVLTDTCTRVPRTRILNKKQ